MRVLHSHIQMEGAPLYDNLHGRRKKSKTARTNEIMAFKATYFCSHMCYISLDKRVPVERGVLPQGHGESHGDGKVSIILVYSKSENE